MQNDIRELLDRWARWRIYRATNELGWPKADSLGRAMSGMPGVKCPNCKGSGKRPKGLKGRAIMFYDCPICEGKGKIKLDVDPSKANPAFIRSTKPRGYDDDEVSARLDWLICHKLTEQQFEIVFMEFTRSGTQYEKSVRMRLTYNAYKMRLLRTTQKLDKLLRE